MLDVKVDLVVMLKEVDLVVGDFNGAAWRRTTTLSIIEQTDQSCHHEVWLHLDFVERRSGQ